MRIAGVRLDDGASLWTDAGDRVLQVMDRVDIRVDGNVLSGTVFVTPEQIMVGGADAAAEILSVGSPASSEPDDELPGADMPPLGSLLTVDAVSGTVLQIDAVNRTVRIRTEDGTEPVVAWPTPPSHLPLRQG